MAARPGAKLGDRIVATDIHLVNVPPPAVPGVLPLPHSFRGELKDSLSPNVYFEGKEAAVVGSMAKNDPAHKPTKPGTSFVKPPDNIGVVTSGSETVLINGKPAARAGDPARTCGDPPNDGAIVEVTSSDSVEVG